MTEAADRQHVRFLGGVIAMGFFTVSLTLALIFAEGGLPVVVTILALVGLYVSQRGELVDFDQDSATEPTEVATDGGLEMDRPTETGGDRNRRSNN